MRAIEVSWQKRTLEWSDPDPVDSNEGDSVMPSSQIRHWGKLIGGLILLLVGLVWGLQGLNVLGGSAMSGHAQWLLIGAVLAILGAWLIRGGIRDGS